VVNRRAPGAAHALRFESGVEIAGEGEHEPQDVGAERWSAAAVCVFVTAEFVFVVTHRSAAGRRRSHLVQVVRTRE
jgi:hypothetical protein